MSSQLRTPPPAVSQKENPRTRRVKAAHLGKRVPLSPSKAQTPPSNKDAVDALSKDLDNLSFKANQSSAKPAPTKTRSHPLAAPPLRSFASSSTGSLASTDDSSATHKHLPSDTSKARSYKPIEDYRSPIQLLTRDPDWAALAPQAQRSMLGSEHMSHQATSVVKNDWKGRKATVSEATKTHARSLSTSAVPSMPKPIEKNDEGLHQASAVQVGADDRFIPQRGEDGGFHAGHSLAAPAPAEITDAAHDHRLRSALDLQPDTDRILSFATAAPRAREDPTFAMQRELTKPAYARPGGVGTSNGVYTNKTRRIPTAPERVLDAPGMIDDYYLNLIAWSCTNVVGVALGEHTYMWNAQTNETEQLGTCDEGAYVSSLDFSNDGSYAGIGVSTGAVEIWDLEAGTRLRSMVGHQSQVSVLSWNNHIISSGCTDGSIWHHDVRVPNHKVMELIGHTGEVCGLKWRQDGEALASGANDNIVNCWDARVGDVGAGARGQPKWSKTSHTAAVKAIAWAPWNPNILASGGGMSDCRVNIWSASTGARLHTLVTPSQVTSIQFSPHSKEIFTTHGHSTNAIMLHSYPSLEKVAEIRDAHDARILNSAISPNGDLVVTNGGDENIKFWRIWESASKKKSRKENPKSVQEQAFVSIR